MIVCCGVRYCVYGSINAARGIARGRVVTEWEDPRRPSDRMLQAQSSYLLHTRMRNACYSIKRLHIVGRRSHAQQRKHELTTQASQYRYKPCNQYGHQTRTLRPKQPCSYHTSRHRSTLTCTSVGCNTTAVLIQGHPEGHPCAHQSSSLDVTAAIHLTASSVDRKYSDWRSCNGSATALAAAEGVTSAAAVLDPDSGVPNRCVNVTCEMENDTAHPGHGMLRGVIPPARSTSTPKTTFPRHPHLSLMLPNTPVRPRQPSFPRAVAPR